MAHSKEAKKLKTVILIFYLNFLLKTIRPTESNIMYDHNKICVEPFNHAQHDDISSIWKLKTFTNRILVGTDQCNSFSMLSIVFQIQLHIAKDNVTFKWCSKPNSPLMSDDILFSELRQMHACVCVCV